MALYRYRPVANGLRTDHPIPDLPFVDDSHIPVEDPAAIEAIGRNKGEGMWGREDECASGGWLAFTTDPLRHDLAWVVRRHPKHGQSVIVYRDKDASPVHMVFVHEARAALLFRAGGYWWDGDQWYRPAQIWDGAAEEYYKRLVPAPVTVTAKDLLPGGDPSKGRVLSITELDADGNASASDRWRDDLALWASHRDAVSLADSVVTLAAPELTGDQLVGIAEMAKIAGIEASTLRAYVSRGEGDVPPPQSTVHGRSAWARPVAEEWAEQRRRDREGLTTAVSADRDGNSLPVGIAEVWGQFSRIFFSQLWERPSWRKRWALRWRTETAVREIAEELSWDVAASVPTLVPIYDLAVTIRHAMLDELAQGKRLRHDLDEGTEPHHYEPHEHFGIVPAVAKMLDWLIRHDPSLAGHTIGEIIGEADREHGIPRHVAENSITDALDLDGTLDTKARTEFLQRVLTPEANRGDRPA